MTAVCSFCGRHCSAADMAGDICHECEQLINEENARMQEEWVIISREMAMDAENPSLEGQRCKF